MANDPAWLKAMKKEAEKLGIPIRELLTRSMKPSKTKPKTKPKAKPKAKTMTAKRGGAVKKFGKGGVNEWDTMSPKEIAKQMEIYKKNYLLELQKEYGKKDGLSIFKEMDEMGMFRKGGAVKKMKRGGTAKKKK